MNDQNNDTATFKTYSLVFIALTIITLISTGMSSLKLGMLNPIITISLGIISALVILVRYMNVSLQGGFFRLLAAGVVALGLLVAFVGYLG